MATNAYDRELELLFADNLAPEEEQELAALLNAPPTPAASDDDSDDLYDLFN